MSARHDPSAAGPHPHPERPPAATFRSAEPSRFRADPHAGTADDTVADDCAVGFLDELDETLWLLGEVPVAAASSFAHAARKADHIEEFRRLIYRLHVLLACWEQEAATG
jgi:hypothetical protein